MILLLLPAALASDTWHSVRDGLRWLERSASGPLDIWAAEIDLCADGVSVRATQYDERKRTTSSFASLVGASVAVNGDFFSYSDYTVSGMAIGDGEHWDDDNSSEGFAAFGADTSWISPPSEVWKTPADWMDDAVGGRPLLVEEGSVFSSYSDPSHCADEHPRTAVGLTRDRQTLILVVVDGRTSASVGVTCAELADIMVDLGAWTALNFDGGGSSTLWVTGEGVVNNPSDGSERTVGNHLAVLFGSGGPEACDWWQDEVILEASELDLHHTDVDGDGKADLCARGSASFRCALANGDGTFGDTWTVEELSDASGWNDETNYASLRMADVDGDGRADACGRGNARVMCWPSSGAGFGARIDGPELSDDLGYDDPLYGTTLRFADVDGDGRDDACARGPDGFRCWPSDGTGFGDPGDVLALSDESGWGHPEHYGTIRMGDVNGDGRADACARGNAGMFCWPSTGTGWGDRVDGPLWDDDHGWDHVSAWSTIQLHDIDRDGLFDLCGRGPEGVECARSNGAGFDPAFAGPGMSDENGWGDHDNHSTLRWGDVDGDGDLDLCARANAGVYCWLQEGDSFATRVDGPALSDDSGWTRPRFYSTVRLGDVTGDGKADLCARAAAGIRCYPSNGAGFDASVAGPEWSDDLGWDGIEFYSTMRMAGPWPVPADPGDTGNGDTSDVDTASGDTAHSEQRGTSTSPEEGRCGCGTQAAGGAFLPLAVALARRRRISASR